MPSQRHGHIPLGIIIDKMTNKKNKLLIVSILFVLCVLLYGCVSSEGISRLSWINIDNSEMNSRCVVLSKGLANQLSFENSNIKKLDHDRIRISAEIRNRTNRSILIEMSTSFRDSDNYVCDETPWQKYSLTANQTLSYNKSSVVAAEGYTIRIRNTN